MVHHTRAALLATPKPPETVQVEEYADAPVVDDDETTPESAAQGGPQ
jgi:hypothetical protein